MKFSGIYLFMCIIFKAAFAERLHGQIYSTIEGGAACFRRLNGTHQAGCSSADSGAVGVVQFIMNVSDAQWLVYNATSGPYMAIVSTAMFHNVIELFMEYPNNLAGILLHDTEIERTTSFTQESRCPNEYSSAQGSQCSSAQAGGIVWNENGTNLLRRDIPFPIFYLPKTRVEEIDKIEQCFKRYNLDKLNQNGKPLCSLQLHSFMFAAVNSVVCLRRSASTALLTPTKVCDPLGDHNVYYSLFPRSRENNSTKQAVTLVTARIDTASLFDGVAPGAASSVVGLATFIAAATVLAKMIPATDAALYNNNVLWTLLNGEAFDYIGSQRIAYDLSRGAWPATPLSPADIKLHVEIGQVGGGFAGTNNDDSWPLYAYAPYTSVVPSKVTEFLAEMSNNINPFNISFTPELTTNIPPSSLHSFRRILKNETEGGDLPEILIVDHKETFTNKFYQSVLDDYDAIMFAYHNISVDTNGTFISTEELLANGTMKASEMQVKISRLATALSRTLYQQVTGKPYSGNETASAHLVDEMLYCFLRSQACRLLIAADYASSSEDLVHDRPVPLYVGVAAWMSPPAVFAGHIIALLTGSVKSVNKTGCDSIKEPGYLHYWLRGWNNSGICIQTTMNFSQAVSPAFIQQDYDFTSGVYSTWTESVWQAMWARVFVSSSGQGAKLAAVSGAVVTIVTLIVTFWIQKHAAVVFVNAPTEPVINGWTLGTVNC